MGPDDNVHLALSQCLEGFPLLFGSSESIQILHAAGEVFQSVAEGAVVLKGQQSSGYEHGHLFAVGHGFKGSPQGDLRLSKAHISTNEAVHWHGTFHIRFDIGRGLHLIRCVLIEE